MTKRKVETMPSSSSEARSVKHPDTWSTDSICSLENFWDHACDGPDASEESAGDAKKPDWESDKTERAKSDDVPMAEGEQDENEKPTARTDTNPSSEFQPMPAPDAEETWIPISDTPCKQFSEQKMNSGAVVSSRCYSYASTLSASMIPASKLGAPGWLLFWLDLFKPWFGASDSELQKIGDVLIHLENEIVLMQKIKNASAHCVHGRASKVFQAPSLHNEGAQALVQAYQAAAKLSSPHAVDILSRQLQLVQSGQSLQCSLSAKPLLPGMRGWKSMRENVVGGYLKTVFLLLKAECRVNEKDEPITRTFVRLLCRFISMCAELEDPGCETTVDAGICNYPVAMTNSLIPDMLGSRTRLKEIFNRRRQALLKCLSNSEKLGLPGKDDILDILEDSGGMGRAFRTFLQLWKRVWCLLTSVEREQGGPNFRLRGHILQLGAKAISTRKQAMARRPATLTLLKEVRISIDPDHLDLETRNIWRSTGQLTQQFI